jgi:hypothetical protein
MKLFNRHNAVALMFVPRDLLASFHLISTKVYRDIIPFCQRMKVLWRLQP